MSDYLIHYGTQNSARLVGFVEGAGDAGDALIAFAEANGWKITDKTQIYTSAGDAYPAIKVRGKTGTFNAREHYGTGGVSHVGEIRNGERYNRDAQTVSIDGSIVRPMPSTYRLLDNWRVVVDAPAAADWTEVKVGDRVTIRGGRAIYGGREVRAGSEGTVVEITTDARAWTTPARFSVILDYVEVYDRLRGTTTHHDVRLTGLKRSAIQKVVPVHN